MYSHNKNAVPKCKANARYYIELMNLYICILIEFFFIGTYQRIQA